MASHHVRFFDLNKHLDPGHSNIELPFLIINANSYIVEGNKQIYARRYVTRDAVNVEDPAVSDFKLLYNNCFGHLFFTLHDNAEKLYLKHVRNNSRHKIVKEVPSKPFEFMSFAWGMGAGLLIASLTASLIIDKLKKK